MKVRVFHLNWSLANDTDLVGKMVMGLRDGHLRDSLSTKSVNRLFTEEIDTYTLVAIVDTNSINEVFRLTNTIDWAWWENKGVEAIIENTRSTSVGDLYLLEDGSLRLVRPFGFLDIAA